MSEDFRDAEERMWLSHGRWSRNNYQLSFKARWKSRWRFFRRLGFWRALRHPLQFKHQMRVCAIDVLKYQDCVRRRREYLDLFKPAGLEPFLADLSPYANEDRAEPNWFTFVLDETGSRLEEPK